MAKVTRPCCNSTRNSQHEPGCKRLRHCCSLLGGKCTRDTPDQQQIEELARTIIEDFYESDSHFPDPVCKTHEGAVKLKQNAVNRIADIIASHLAASNTCNNPKETP